MSTDNTGSVTSSQSDLHRGTQYSADLGSRPGSQSGRHPHAAASTCLNCGRTVSVRTPDGSRRNHCPSCLHSRHTATAGDHTDSTDSAACGARMAPISVAVLRGGDWLLVHRCTGCEALTTGPVSPDDNRLVLVRMAVRPLAQPPFPLEAFADL